MEHDRAVEALNISKTRVAELEAERQRLESQLTTPAAPINSSEVMEGALAKVLSDMSASPVVPA
eukprot:7778049-Karenia_brevis.AAC.1